MDMEMPLHKMTKPLLETPPTLPGKIVEATDGRTIAIRFNTTEERQAWTVLAQRLGHDEHSLARHLLTNFIGHCKI